MLLIMHSDRFGWPAIRWLAILVAVLLCAGCWQDAESRLINKYLAFYYPTTGNYTYEIVHDNGSWLIHTGHDVQADTHPDSQPYRGFIVMRAQKDGTIAGAESTVYLITPDGAVWTRADDGSIPAWTERLETQVTETAASTSVLETRIRSFSEPVIDDFLANPEAWQHYKNLKKS